MKRYLIERDILNIGHLTRAQLKDLAATSNSVIYRLSGKVQWVQSFIAADKSFCIYLAESELLVRGALAAGRLPHRQDHRSADGDRSDDRLFERAGRGQGGLGPALFRPVVPML